MALLAFGVALALLLCAAATASARVAYTPARPLSQPAAASYGLQGVQAAVDAAGRVTVVWVRDNTVELARIGPDGTAGPVQVLANPGDSPALAVDQAGNATVVWRWYDGNVGRIYTRRVEADGSVGSVQQLSEPGVGGGAPRVAVDPSGRATVVWNAYAYDDPLPQQVDLARISAAGVAGPAETISRNGGFEPQLAVAPSGAAIVAWQRPAREVAVWVAPDGTPAKTRTLPQNNSWEELTQPSVVADTEGRFTVAWGTGTVGLKILRVGADGSPGPLQIVTVAGYEAGRPELTIDDTDRIDVFWNVCRDCSDRFSEPHYGIRAMTLGSSGAVGHVVPVAQGDEPYLRAAAPGPGTQATVLWSTGGGTGLQSARLTEDGHVGSYAPASRPSTDTNYGDVVVDSAGVATVVWVDSAAKEIEFSRSYDDSHLDGSATIHSKQRVRHGKPRIVARVDAGELLTARARASVGLGLSPTLKSGSKRIAAGKSKRLVLRPAKHKRRLFKAFRKRGRVRARVEITLEDRAGNRRSYKQKVLLTSRGRTRSPSR